MIFSSLVYIFLFLPITVALYWILDLKFGRNYAAIFLIISSLFFYGWWDFHYSCILAGSIVFNYGIYNLLIRYHSAKWRILIFGIVCNLAFLFYFKYVSFVLGTWDKLFGTGFNFPKLILPLAISFFTFQQIAFIVDTYKGKVPTLNFRNYVLFMTFYPHLIAGPILHHSEIMPQFDEDRRRSFWDCLVPGITRFAVGAFKKVFIADNIGILVDSIFAAADGGQPLSAMDAWAATIGYTIQLYFDFSGYADMAIGSAILLGIRLPENFDSPYRATSIIEFWRRWHMTLSRWLRDYLYIPLGGNRGGRLARYRNVFITMLLGGIWHGAGYNFVIWGAFHGALIVVNQYWASLTRKMSFVQTRTWAVVGWATTLICVMIGWVFFRATTPSGAIGILAGMWGFGEEPTRERLSRSDIGILGIFGPQTYMFVMVAIMLAAVTLPNSTAIERWASDKAQENSGMAIILGAVLGLGFAIVIASLEQGAQKFLYFDF